MACKDTIKAREFLQRVDELAKEYDANYFIVTDGASKINNNGNPAVDNCRRAQEDWERQNGFDPDEDWGVKAPESCSFFNGEELKRNLQSYLDSRGITADEYYQEILDSQGDGIYIIEESVVHKSPFQQFQQNFLDALADAINKEEYERLDSLYEKGKKEENWNTSKNY